MTEMRLQSRVQSHLKTTSSGILTGLSIPGHPLKCVRNDQTESLYKSENSKFHDLPGIFPRKLLTLVQKSSHTVISNNGLNNGIETATNKRTNNQERTQPSWHNAQLHTDSLVGSNASRYLDGWLSTQQMHSPDTHTQERR